jgi:hypothetical protein
LRIIIEKAREMGSDIGGVRHALMGAERCPHRFRWFRQRRAACQTASADMGSVA